MNVLVVVEQLRRAVPGGIGTYARGLLQGLAAMGAADRPRLALHASRPPRGGSAGDPLAAIGPPVAASRLPAPLLTRAWDRGLLGPPRSAADVVHATSLAFPRVRGRGHPPLTVMVHDVAWREVPEAFPRRGRRWHEGALQRALREAAAVVVPSQPVADRLGAPAGRVVVIPEGCDHLPPADAGAAAELLRRAGVDPTDGYLLTVSTVEPRKNLARLLAAYAEARAALAAPWPLVVVGARGWGDGLPEHVPEGVVLAGRVEDAALAALYEGTRCFAYVPLLEGFGLPPVEAMRAGAPVVASDMPSIGAGAMVVDPTDVAAIARALVVASADGPERDDLVVRGRARAAELTWEATARAHVDLWRSVVDR